MMLSPMELMPSFIIFSRPTPQPARIRTLATPQAIPKAEKAFLRFCLKIALVD